MLFADKLTLDKPRRTTDGYLVVRAKAARTGVYQYAGTEVDPNNDHGLRDQALVNVLRDDETVFDKKAVHSFIGKPVTVDHPHEAVTADNWKDHASGVVMGALKDGEHLSFDLLLTDKAAITAVEDGKRELSNGYAAELVFGDFQAADGTACQAKQVSIRGNHVAIVDRGRAGSECAIADAARCTSLPADVFDLLTDERTYSDGNGSGNNGPARRETSSPSGGLRVTQDGEKPVTTKPILLDGYTFEVDAALETAIVKVQGELRDAAARAQKAEADLATLTTDKAKLEGEKAALETQLKDATDPAKLQAAAAARSALVDKAKAVIPNIVVDGKSDADLRKEVVTAKLGDDAKDFDDAKIEGAFAMLAKDAKPGDVIRDAISSGVRSTANDSGASVRDLARASQF
jgi:hypothetical protein